MLAMLRNIFTFVFEYVHIRMVALPDTINNYTWTNYVEILN